MQSYIRLYKLIYETKSYIKLYKGKTKCKTGLFSVYRDRLKRKGVIDTSEYGKITLTLPRFEEFVKTRQM